MYIILLLLKIIPSGIFRSRLDGLGLVEQVTPEKMEGQSNYQMSADAKWAIQTFQNVATPPTISLISLPSHKEIRKLEDNHEVKEKYELLRLNQKQFFKVAIGDLELDAYMIKPIGFNPAKKYPLLFMYMESPLELLFRMPGKEATCGINIWLSEVILLSA